MAGSSAARQGRAGSRSFFLRDATREFPIYIPAYGVVATSGEDSQSYADIVDAIRARGRQTKLARIESEPEESFEEAAAATRNLKVQTWLGLGRDIRLFAVGERLDWIQPRFHGHEVALPEAGNKPVRYNYLAGRGWGSRDEITRRLGLVRVPRRETACLRVARLYILEPLIGLALGIPDKVAS